MTLSQAWSGRGVIGTQEAQPNKMESKIFLELLCIDKNIYKRNMRPDLKDRWLKATIGKKRSQEPWSNLCMFTARSSIFRTFTVAPIWFHKVESTMCFSRES
jgi:hypothetical protein